MVHHVVGDAHPTRMDNMPELDDKGRETLEGWVPDAADHAELFRALEKAFDYRGDVTVTLRDERVIAGYIFDRRTGQGLEDSCVRMIPADADERIEIIYADIARLEFSGKDTAAGKSWENWVKRYIEKKRAGEKACIESEPLDDSDD